MAEVACSVAAALLAGTCGDVLAQADRAEFASFTVTYGHVAAKASASSLLTLSSRKYRDILAKNRTENSVYTWRLVTLRTRRDAIRPSSKRPQPCAVRRAAPSAPGRSESAGGSEGAKCRSRRPAIRASGADGAGDAGDGAPEGGAARGGGARSARGGGGQCQSVVSRCQSTVSRCQSAGDHCFWTPFEACN